MVRLLAALLLRASLRGTAASRAADLSIALGADVTSIDPHFHNLTPNNNVGQPHLRDARRQGRARTPAARRSPSRGARSTISRGSSSCAKASSSTTAPISPPPTSRSRLDRVPTVPNSPSPFTIYSKQITEKIVVDPLTIRLKTATPYPLMPNDMAHDHDRFEPRGERRVDRRLQQRQGGDRHRARSSFVRWQKGDRIELARNDALLGAESAVGPRHLPRHHVRPDARRVAARGRSARDRERADRRSRESSRRTPTFRVYRIVSHRVMYLHLDSARDKSPFVTDKAGQAARQAIR